MSRYMAHMISMIDRSRDLDDWQVMCQNMENADRTYRRHMFYERTDTERYRKKINGYERALIHWLNHVKVVAHIHLVMGQILAFLNTWRREGICFWYFRYWSLILQIFIYFFIAAFPISSFFFIDIQYFQSFRYPLFFFNLIFVCH